MSEYVDLEALWKVLVIGLVAGAGLVAVYALGLAALGATRATGSRQVGTVVAGGCFLLVAAGAVLGIYVMLAK